MYIILKCIDYGGILAVFNPDFIYFSNSVTVILQLTHRWYRASIHLFFSYALIFLHAYSYFSLGVYSTFSMYAKHWSEARVTINKHKLHLPPSGTLQESWQLRHKDSRLNFMFTILIVFHLESRVTSKLSMRIQHFLTYNHLMATHMLKMQIPCHML